MSHDEGIPHSRSFFLAGDVFPLTERYGGPTVKKTIKKLTLNRETLRNLNEEQLQDIAGGGKSKQYSECPDLSCGFACTAIDCA